MNAMDQTIAGAVLERAHIASPKGSLSQAKGQRSNTAFITDATLFHVDICE